MPTATAVTPPEQKYATVSDALEILRSCVGLPHKANELAHDFNGNGRLDVGDALMVLRGLVGLDKKQVVGDNFVHDKIVVSLTYAASWRDNRDWTPDDFWNIGVIKVRDIIRASDREWELIQEGRWLETLLDIGHYRRWMSLELDTNCRENLFQVMSQLQLHPDIEMVSFAYGGGYALG
jgi:hypothetical protein